MARDLARAGNDLEAPAIALAPPIGAVLAALAARPGCLLARMSGSGATCFGLFATPAAASGAADGLARPGWWCWGGGLVGAAAWPPIEPLPAGASPSGKAADFDSAIGGSNSSAPTTAAAPPGRSHGVIAGCRGSPLPSR